jgi:hypothetical protein
MFDFDENLSDQNYAVLIKIYHLMNSFEDEILIVLLFYINLVKLNIKNNMKNKEIIPINQPFSIFACNCAEGISGNCLFRVDGL